MAVSVRDTVIMQLPGIILLAVLAAAVLVATGWVVYNMVRVAICIIRDSRKARHPLRQLEDPRLGTLIFDLNLWSGRIRQRDRDVHFFIAGTESGPDGEVLAQLHAALDKLPEIEHLAVAFLCRDEPHVQPAEFTLESLDFLWKGRPNDFAIELGLAGDDEGI